MAKTSIIKKVEKTVGAAAHGIETFEQEIEMKARPIRESVFNRFPTLFILLTTFGVTSVLFGFEGLIAGTPFLADRPWLILLIGVSVLGFTGTLYSKLGNR